MTKGCAHIDDVEAPVDVELVKLVELVDGASIVERAVAGVHVFLALADGAPVARRAPRRRAAAAPTAELGALGILGALDRLELRLGRWRGRGAARGVTLAVARWRICVTLTEARRAEGCRVDGTAGARDSLPRCESVRGSPAWAARSVACPPLPPACMFHS